MERPGGGRAVGQASAPQWLLRFFGFYGRSGRSGRSRLAARKRRLDLDQGGGMKMFSRGRFWDRPGSCKLNCKFVGVGLDV
jgi:hypothetical protein